MPTRLRDGVHFEYERTVVADARSAVGDVNVVSHAHADHLFRRRARNVVCSAATATLATARTGEEVPYDDDPEGIDLLPAGHVVGSRAALFEAGGRRHLYTGDVSTRDRFGLSGFDPVPADELVVETTYGHPDYRFPDQGALEARIVDWLADRESTPLVLFGYSFGRAQEIQRLVERATNRRVVVHDAVAEMNDAVEAATGRTFDATPLSAVGRPASDDVVVAPPHLARSSRIERLVARLGATTAGFSGWAVEDAYRYRGGFDETFVLSDHCDFDELVALVRAVDPERVYTHHGHDEAFAAHLASEHDYDARPLVRGQTALDEFGGEP